MCPENLLPILPNQGIFFHMIGEHPFLITWLGDPIETANPNLLDKVR